ncbi:MAG: TonB-dependent receptor [Gemmatimonadaceae bacterium]|nr:TonB-dependent receptor [Gemmatimonadaceae bacterium]
MCPPILPRHAALMLCASLLAATLPAQVPGALRARVVDDRTGQPLSGVEVTITATSRAATTDSSGAFTLRDVALGRHEVVLRKVGYQQLSTAITSTASTDSAQPLRLVAVAAELAKVVVTTPVVNRRLLAFEAHRAERLSGSFLTAAELEKERGRSLGDVLQRVMGTDLVRGYGGQAWFATRRGYDSIRYLPQISETDRQRGASSGRCYAAVVLNSVFVYRGTGDDLFDVNSLAPDEVLAIEVYKGGASMPLEYNAPRSTCGLLVIYTK